MTTVTLNVLQLKQNGINSNKSKIFIDISNLKVTKNTMKCSY